jgi:hypothetical protein
MGDRTCPRSAEVHVALAREQGIAAEAEGSTDAT